MQSLLRFSLAVLLAAFMVRGAQATENGSAREAEYQRSDTNFYWKGDVLKAYPSAVIVPAGKYNQKGDSYFFTPEKKAPKVIYIQVVNDWVEPLTPPDMPASLGIAPDAMQIRDVHGDVQVALPSAPATFGPVTEGATLSNGAVIKTGADGTAAVLFGGVSSARLIPNSEAAVQQTVSPKARSTEVDLTTGAVFSKVGKQADVAEDYRVQTPFGAAAARGTDFVTVAMPARTDVWIAQGTVQLDAPDGKMVGVVSSEGTGPLKIIRFPLMTDPHRTMMADSETMTAAMNFIPLVNQDVKALRDKISQGTTLTATEQDYLNRIKEVPCLIKLALVPPPAPPPPAPAPTPSPASSTPIELDLRADGQVDFQGATLTLEILKQKLQEVAQANPGQLLVINKAAPNVGNKLLKKVVAMCHAAKLKVLVAKPTVNPPSPPAEPPPTAAPPVPAPAASETPATNLPPPSFLMHPSTDLMSSNAPPESPSTSAPLTPSSSTTNPPSP
jgi:hypothetical protein